MTTLASGCKACHGLPNIYIIEMFSFANCHLHVLDTSQVDLEEVKNHMRRTHRPSINDSSPMSGRRFSFKEKVHRSMEMMDKLDRRMSLISGGASHDSVVT